MIDSDGSAQEGICALAAETIVRFGQLRLRVTGASMLPVLRPGDLLYFQSYQPEQAVAGDILLYRRDNRLVVHRLVRHGEDGLITQGDSLAGPDAPVAPCDVLGRVTSVHRRGRSLSAAALRPTMTDRLGRWLIRRSFLAMRLFLRWHYAVARHAA